MSSPLRSSLSDVQSSTAISSQGHRRPVSAIAKDFQAITDHQTLLKQGRETILGAIDAKDEALDQCSEKVAFVWEYILNLQRTKIEFKQSIEDWQQKLSTELLSGEIERQISHSQDLTRRKSQYERRIHNAWKVSSSEVLDQTYISANGLATKNLRYLAELSELTSLDEARSRLSAKIEERIDSKHRTRGWRRDRKIMLSDTMSVVDDVKFKEVMEHPTIRHRPLLDTMSANKDAKIHETLSHPNIQKRSHKRRKISHGNREFHASEGR
jgi:hypothetical protein